MVTRNLGYAAVLGIGMVLLASCGGAGLPSNDRLVEGFQEGRTGIWVSGHGDVTRPSVIEPGAVPRQRITVRISPELTVTIRHDLSQAPRVPVERGDTISFQGYYEFDASGGNITRTHADESQPGGGGWIAMAGTRYE